MSIDLKIAKEEDAELWDDLVDKSPHGTLFHTWKFLKIMEKHTPSKLYPLIGMKGTTPIGVYPLFFQKRFFLKMVFSPPPHCAVPYLGPLLSNCDKIKQSKRESLFIDFHRSIDNFIYSEFGSYYTYIAVSPKIVDCRPFKWTGYQVHPRYSYSIEISNIEKTWENMHKDRRNKINRAKKDGIVIEIGSQKEFLEIYDLMVKRYTEQNRLVTVPRDYLMDIYGTFYPHNLRVLVAKYNGETISGTVDAFYKDRTYFWIGNPKPYVKISNVNELLTWESMKCASINGSKYHEILGVATTKKLYGHYSKFNPSISPYFYAIKKNVASKIFEIGYEKVLKPLKARLYLKNENRLETS